MKIYKISAVTLIVENMERSCRFYSQVPGFKLVYGSSDDTFTTFEIGEEEKHKSKMYLNLELEINNNHEPHNYTAENINDEKRQHFGRLIFHTEDVDRLYSYFKNNDSISNLISFENEPTNAAWGERYFHIREPDGYQLSFAEPIAGNKEDL
ncbi:MAG TPA: VOC family protein [Nitrososphaeraceae archaeon]|jgi:catechol 2,3-dioxygenase-like lactoylglutathione lyase family enzyme